MTERRGKGEGMAKLTIGEAMRRCRKRKDMTLAELSERSGVGVSTLYRAEGNYGYPHVLALTACADVLGVSLDEYIGRGEYGESSR